MTVAVEDRFVAIRKVADAVLYEGAVLYPYRASSQKNHLRWQFGVLAPRVFAEASGSEAFSMQAECLIETGRRPARIVAHVRGLQLEERRVEAPVGSARDGFQPVASLEVDRRLFTSFDETVEHDRDRIDHNRADLRAGHRPMPSANSGAEPATASTRCEASDTLDASVAAEDIHDLSGATAGRVVRRRCRLSGLVSMQCQPIGFGLSRLSITVENRTDWTGGAGGRDEVVRHSLVGVHLLLAVDGGKFLSLIDPPERAKAAAQACKNQGCFPVLAGPKDQDDLMLVAPIILYDHPERIAPESAGDMCDATEIDGILALRTLTLTEEEKRRASRHRPTFGHDR